MAIIKIRGRAEPLTIDDERARKVKNRKFGTGGVPKAEPTELVDLGVWSGEYGRIVEVEFPSSEKDDVAEMRRKLDQLDRQKFLSLSPKLKAQRVGWFKILYAGRLGDWRAEPSPELLDRVVAFQETWYASHPKSMPMQLSSRDYGDLLPERSYEAPTLAEKMRVNHES